MRRLFFILFCWDGSAVFAESAEIPARILAKTANTKIVRNCPRKEHDFALCNFRAG